ncbi:MAG: hypothetical protein IPJ26_16925 [Bacteroidetes bacterium]|nr:hypothetical protein [Bacteroidota bacterium]
MLNLKSLEIDANRVSIPIENLADFINLLEMDQRITKLELIHAEGRKSSDNTRAQNDWNSKSV